MPSASNRSPLAHGKQAALWFTWGRIRQVLVALVRAFGNAWPVKGWEGDEGRKADIAISFRTLALMIIGGWLAGTFFGLVVDARTTGSLAGGRTAVPPMETTTYTTTVVDITFLSSWDGTTQRASLALPTPLPTSPMPVVIYLHGMFSCYQQRAPHRDAAESIGPVVAQRGWVFAAPELHGERPVPLPGDPWDPAAGCPSPVSVGYRPMGARPAQRDVLDVLAYVQRTYPVDPTRVYLLSDSAGGLTLLTTLGKFPDYFAAAVVYASPTDLARWLTEDPRAYPNIWREVGGLPEEVPFAYARRSPLSFAGNLVHTPLLLVHGRQDERVPVHHARDLYQAIRAARSDAPVTLREYDGNHSGPFDPNDPNFVTYAQALDWLAAFRRPAPPNAIHAVTDADEEEQGPYRFWWAAWTPLPGPERWITVTVTHTATVVTGVVEDTVGLTFTLNLADLGWPTTPVTVTTSPPVPPVSQVITPVDGKVRFPLPGGRVAFTVTTTMPTPTTGTLQGVVFDDANGNGQYDPDEPGIPGSRVVLREAGQPIAQVTTGEDGRYRFAGLKPGTYLVTEVSPPCYEDVTVNAYWVVITAGEVVERNFGNRRQWCAWLPTLSR